MRFWDASAVVPLLVHEVASGDFATLARQDQPLVVWWGTPVECASALSRLGRGGAIPDADADRALDLLRVLAEAWTEVLPSDQVRALAIRLLRVHPLRAADALQLAAALVWAEGAPAGREIVTRDDRLAGAARKEGFVTLPATR